MITPVTAPPPVEADLPWSPVRPRKQSSSFSAAHLDNAVKHHIATVSRTRQDSFKVSDVLPPEPLAMQQQFSTRISLSAISAQSSMKNLHIRPSQPAPEHRESMVRVQDLPPPMHTGLSYGVSIDLKHQDVAAASAGEPAGAPALNYTTSEVLEGGPGSPVEAPSLYGVSIPIPPRPSSPEASAVATAAETAPARPPPPGALGYGVPEPSGETGAHDHAAASPGNGGLRAPPTATASPMHCSSPPVEDVGGYGMPEAGASQGPDLVPLAAAPSSSFVALAEDSGYGVAEPGQPAPPPPLSPLGTEAPASPGLSQNQSSTSGAAIPADGGYGMPEAGLGDLPSKASSSSPKAPEAPSLAHGYSSFEEEAPALAHGYSSLVDELVSPVVSSGPDPFTPPSQLGGGTAAATAAVAAAQTALEQQGDEEQSRARGGVLDEPASQETGLLRTLSDGSGDWEGDPDRPVPLLPDAMSLFAELAGRENAARATAEVEAATQTLVHDVVPRLAASLLSCPPAELEFLDFALELHSHGVNLRHMGLIRSYIPRHNHDRRAETLRSRLLVEIVARSLKNMLKDDQRKWMRANRSSSWHGMSLLVAQFLNLISGSHPSSRVFWGEALLEGMVNRFGECCLFPEERLPAEGQEGVMTWESEFRRGGSSRLKDLVFRLAELTGIVFSSQVKSDFDSDPDAVNGYEFLAQDIEELKPVVKYMHIIDYSSSINLIMGSLARREKLMQCEQDAPGTLDAEATSASMRTVKRLENMAHVRLHKAHHAMPRDEDTAQVFQYLTKHLMTRESAPANANVRSL